ncbi:hypothetical protein CYQ88_02080 [Hydrogenovibrio sp. SC-1]|uniref:hypothetical protein n=1 Tax=Hydrogenovibrio sp. SC-1 TaxID=2065820 RepID=UPI000C7C22FC|nr:hypothetical protein [Hydrogenovibrio sp. SC-1]PLA75380.1 hypothetical protein CYQ88_02080 [Hydrogenovibrio sp. SC-1]
MNLLKVTACVSVFSLSLFSSGVFANTALAENGFSFLTAGFETFQYEEKVSLADVNTKVTVTNPVLMTGGLFEVTPQWDFSIRAESSLFPGNSQESWQVNSGASVGSLTSANNPIQTNQFTMTNSSTQLLSQYKLTPQIRLLLGGQYALFTFKRYQFATDYPNTISITNGVVEESTGSLDLNIGAAFESDTSVQSNYRLFGSITIDKPIYRKLVNSNAPDVTFNSTDGYGLTALGGASYQLTKQVHIGVTMMVGYRQTGKEIKVNPATDLQIEIPENTIFQTKYGLSFIYKF